MRLKNSTDFPDYFLRRLVAWCCKQHGLPVKRIREATFRNRTVSYSGHAYYGGRIVVSIGLARDRDPERPEQWKVAPYPARLNEAHNLETLVRVTAHEVGHLYLAYIGSRTRNGGRGNSWGGSERQAERHENYAIDQFKANRDALVATWAKAPKERERPAVVSLSERRAQHAATMLAVWQRKAKLAATKIKQYRRKVAYYERRQAAKRGNTPEGG